MTTPTVSETRRNGNTVGERRELARYTVPSAGERVSYGQRVNGVVRFLGRLTDVFVSVSVLGEDSRCCAREGS